MTLEEALERIAERRLNEIEADIKALYGESEFEAKTEYEHYIEQARDHLWK